MKFFLLIAITILTLNSAQIDKSLYENITDTKQYENIEKTILESEQKKEFPPEIIAVQKSNLKRLKEIISKEVIVEEFNLSLFQKKDISIELFYDSLLFLADSQIKAEKQSTFLNDIQNRLVYFKKNIENQTEENKANLLSHQLQFAYYKIQKNNIETRIKKIIENNQKLLENMILSLPKIKDIQISIIDKLILESSDKINKSLQEKISLEIDIEKESIDENNTNANSLKNKLNIVDKKIQEEQRKLISSYFKKILLTIKNKNEEQYLDTYSLTQKEIEKVDIEYKDLFIKENEIVKEIAKNIFGNTKMILNRSIFEGKDILKQIWSQLTSTLFVFNEQAISILSLIKAILFIIIGFTIGIIYKKWVFKLSKKWPNMSQMSLKLSSNVGFYLIIIITFMITMSSLGIDLSSISLIAGALSIGIGFGLQTVVSNLIAGIILMFERTIRIGDIIEISDLLKGTVTDIRIRSTTIKTFDNIDIVVPNSSFIQNNVINWTLEDPSRRLHIAFGVAYGTEVDKVKETILTELEASDLKYIRDNPDKNPEIRMEMMNASSVDFELLVWIKANDRLQPNSLKSDFLILIYKSLYKHGIEIPFPQLDLHVKNKVLTSQS